MQSTQPAVQILQPRGHADHMALALEGLFGLFQRHDRGMFQGNDAAFGFADRGQIIELLFRLLDLGRGRIVDVGFEGVVDDPFAQFDQLPAQIEVVDNAAVIGDVGDADNAGGQFVEILRAAGAGQSLVGLEEMGQGLRAGFLAALHQPPRGVVDTAMDRLVEMLGLQEIRNLFQRPVVGQDRAQQPGLHLGVMGRDAVDGRRALVVAKRGDRVFGGG